MPAYKLWRCRPCVLHVESESMPAAAATYCYVRVAFALPRTAAALLCPELPCLGARLGKGLWAGLDVPYSALHCISCITLPAGPWLSPALPPCGHAGAAASTSTSSPWGQQGTCEVQPQVTQSAASCWKQVTAEAAEARRGRGRAVFVAPGMRFAELMLHGHAGQVESPWARGVDITSTCLHHRNCLEAVS